MRKTIMSLSTIMLLSVSLQANWKISGIDFKDLPMLKSNMSVSNGGTIPDSEALRDGVGMKILAFSSDNSPDFKTMNQALLGAEEGETLKDDTPELFVSSNDKASGIVKDCYGVEIGSIIDGYLVVDNSTIITERDNGTDMGTLCTSNVTDMYKLFYNQTINGDITKWDTSHVTNMERLFYRTDSFNQPIGNWDTSSVTNMKYLFSGDKIFDQPLNNWNTSNVTTMYGMFEKAESFNQPLNDWNTSNVTNMGLLFTSAKKFNQPLNKWDTSNVTSMKEMFHNAELFNQPLNNWKTSNVTDLHYIFYYADSFNQPLDKWDTSNVTTVKRSFNNAKAFNQDLSGWDMDNIQNSVDYDKGADNWEDSNKPIMPPS